VSYFPSPFASLPPALSVFLLVAALCSLSLLVA
jgi:hypothetical protein